jgi:rhodanese-related sulfurtransferase
VISARFVRRAAFEGGHVPGALHLPLDRLEREASRFQTARPMAAACAVGCRSSAACSLLESHGFCDLVNVVGGTSARIAAGHAVERGRPPSL